MIRLKDIAEKANVSVMTVSKALRNARDISHSTRSRIQAIAQELGYVPDAMAQSLRTGATKLIGLVIPSVTNPIFGRVVLAIQDRAHELGYEIILAHSANSEDREFSTVLKLIARRVDGLIISPVPRMDPNAKAFDELLKQKIPTVILGQRSPFCSRFPGVESDDLESSYSATQHLLGLGHRQIAFLAGPSASPSALERLNGYKRALRESGVELDDRVVFHAGATVEDGERAALLMVNEGAQFTAIIAVNDLVAIGAANTFLKQGLLIPRDFSIIGFGNTLVSENFKVPLSTIGLPKYALGEVAMETLIKCIHGESPETRRLPAQLVIRESSGPAPFCPPLPSGIQNE